MQPRLLLQVLLMDSRSISLMIGHDGDLTFLVDGHRLKFKVWVMRDEV